jgi:hypothetical protein
MERPRVASDTSIVAAALVVADAISLISTVQPIVRPNTHR